MTDDRSAAATSEDAHLRSVADQGRQLAEVLACEVELHSTGGSTRTFALVGTDRIVTVPLAWPEQPEAPVELARRAALQERIARRVHLPVPETVRTVPEHGLVVVRRLVGDRLLDAPPTVREAVRRQVAADVGRLLADLHTWTPAAYEDVVHIDDDPPERWLADAAEVAHDLDPVLDAQQRDDVRRFLAVPPPCPAPALVLSHNDLGIEHVLVDATGEGPTVSGVIDWDDAAVCDPAHDFGLLLRDLGPPALETALAAYAAHDADPAGVIERAHFYARCKLLEDLAFGITEGRPAYVRKSLAGWSELFGRQPDA